MDYSWVEAPYHEWLKVPKKDVEELGILPEISDFSFMDEDFYYLEEDTDACLFRSKKNLSIDDIPQRSLVDNFPHKEGLKRIHSREEVKYNPPEYEIIEIPDNIEELTRF